jgi:hypothetical protein
MDQVAGMSLFRPLRLSMVSYPLFTKVLYLFVVETANTGIDMAMMYQPLILEYGASQN